MRIISGKFKGKVITAPKNIPTRPTTDFAKTGLFNIISNSFTFQNLRVLDLFAGTGSITFEFASRGSNDITCVEQNPVCYKHIKHTLNQLQIGSVKPYRADVLRFLKKQQEPFDIIFADPPFHLTIHEQLINLIFDNKMLKPDGWFILEYASDHEAIKNEYFSEYRKYGQVSFSIYKDLS